MLFISKCNENIVNLVDEMPTNELISELEDSTIEKCNDNNVSDDVKPTPKQNNILRLFRYLRLNKMIKVQATETIKSETNDYCSKQILFLKGFYIYLLSNHTN
jgi:hypothetical protein